MNILEMNSIEKAFGSLKALKKVDFSLTAGTSHGLMGINGAGKSTLMKILSGIYQLDGGEILIQGKPVTIDSPETAEQLGIAIVHQEFSLIPHLSVAENLFISRLPLKNKIIRTVDRTRMIRESKAILAQVGIDIDPHLPVSSLSIGKQQMVEIAKAVSLKEPKIIIFDEPTSALSAGEIDKLFRVIETLKKSGIGIIYITHRLNEIEEICDTVTVLRDGNLIGTFPRKEKSLKELIDLMLGKASTLIRQKESLSGSDETVLALEGLSGENLTGPVSLKLRRGEILGLAGQMGAGRSEVLKTVIGVDKETRGKILFKENPLKGSVEARIKRGIGYVAEDRKREGLLPSRYINENLSISVLHQLLKSGLISSPREERLFDTISERTGLSPRNPELFITQLSGGNQQKVMIGRWLGLQDLQLLLLDEPTRGVDVGAKYQIYQILMELAEQGVSILIASSDLEEILIICDRIVHLDSGRSVEERRTGDLDLNSLTHLISGEAEYSVPAKQDAPPKERI